MGLTGAGFGLCVLGVALFAQPGMFRAVPTPPALAIVFVLGPLAAFAALQLAVCVSSRVNGARSASKSAPSSSCRLPGCR